MREVRKERRQNLKSVVVVLFMEAKKIKIKKKVPNNRFLQSGSIHRSNSRQDAYCWAQDLGKINI